MYSGALLVDNHVMVTVIVVMMVIVDDHMVVVVVVDLAIMETMLVFHSSRICDARP